MNPPATSRPGEEICMDVLSGGVSGKPFIVSVHDVEPQWMSELSSIVEGLRSRVGRAMCAGVVAEPAGKFGSGAFVSFVADHFGEIALHGYSHRSSLQWHPISLLTGRANEFSGLNSVQARERLDRGQQVLAKLFDAPARVFIPPAWCCGAVTSAIAAEAGLPLIVTLRHLLTMHGRMPLATYSWDCGRVAALGYAGEWLGRLAAGIPCVTFHPADVQRGFLKRGFRIVDQLLNAGFEPVTFEQCVRGLETNRNLSNV